MIVFILLGAFWLITAIWLRRRELNAKSNPAWLPKAILAALLATACLIFCLYLFPLTGVEHSFPIDDSYITLTAARNVAEHNLLAVNPEAPLCGVTSPLHSLAVGLLGKLIHIETADRLIGLISLLALVAGIWIWVRQLEGSDSLAAIVAVLCILIGPLTFGALNGMETTLFAALLVWCAVLYETSRQKPRALYLLGVLIGLACLTRPEGWFVAATFFAVKLYDHRREWKMLLRVLGAGLIAGTVVAPYLLANYHLWGLWFPPTVSAKKYFFGEWCMPPRAKFLIMVMASALSVGPFALAFPLIFFAKNWLRRYYPLAFILVFYFAYSSQFPGALAHYWGRYQHPLIPFIVTALVLGADGLTRKMMVKRPLAGRFAGVALATLFFAGGVVGAQIFHAGYRNALQTANHFLTYTYRYLQENTEPTDSIATLDIGVVYYFGNRRITDLVGLADPEVAAIHKQYASSRCDKSDRFEAIYKLLKERRPKIVYFGLQIDDLYLGIRQTDAGRHLREAYVLPHELPVGLDRTIKVMQYHFFQTDWDHDLRFQSDKTAPFTAPSAQ